METVNQPTLNPTRKLSAATVAAALVSFFGLVVRNMWPTWYDPDVWAALLPLAVFAAGWVIKDVPNVPVEDRAE